MARRIMLFFLLALTIAGSVLLINTLRYRPVSLKVNEVEIPVPDESVADRLAEAIRYPTVSYQDPALVRWEELLKLHSYLERAFPAVHTHLRKETPGAYSLLYRWEGKDPTAKPLLYLSHLDVVPVLAESEKEWKYPPFEGRIAEGFVWGRGTLDDKVTVTAILEAAERLLQEGFQPSRDIYFAFGHDEETGGKQGAFVVASHLQSRGLTFESIFDEGLVITDSVFPGLATPVAVIGIAEKGYLTVELTVRSEGGHSSMPPSETTIGILSEAISNLERNPMPASLRQPVRDLFRIVGPEMDFGSRLIFANLWLFEPLVLRKMAAVPSTNSMIRTTTAPTIFHAGIKENVLPDEARAIVNFRIHPGDNVQKVLNHVSNTIHDSRVRIRAVGNGSEPSALSDTASRGYRVLEQTILQVFPDVLVAPSLVLGGTDSRHYSGLSAGIFRFAPLVLRPEDITRVHGVNERISVRNYQQCVRFYYQLFRNSAS